MTRYFTVAATALSFAFVLTACTDRDQAGRADAERRETRQQETTQTQVFQEPARTGDLGQTETGKGSATLEQRKKVVTTEVDTDRESIPTVERTTKQADVNRMDEADFVALGMNKEQAKRVIDYRKKNNFKSIDDLARVPGFDRSWFQKHRNNLAIGDVG